MYNYISSDSNQMLQTVTKTVTCAVYSHCSLWRWKQWEKHCSTPDLVDGVTAHFHLQNCYKLLHTSPPPPDTSSTPHICCELLLWLLILLHLQKHCYKMWQPRPSQGTASQVMTSPNMLYDLCTKQQLLSAWSTNVLRKHLNFPLIYAFFLVFLALSKPLHLYRSFHFFLNSLVLCTFSTGISHSYPTKPL